MSKRTKYLFNSLSFIIGLFFASGIAWFDYKMIIVFGILLIITLLINNQFNFMMFIAELFMFFIFLCRLSVFYSFDNQIMIGKTFQLIFQGFTAITALVVLIVNIISIKKEW